MTVSSRFRSLLIVATATVLVAACSTGSGSAPSSAASLNDGPVDTSGDIDASCSIVTTAAVAQATGFVIATASGAGGICIYQNSDPSRYLSLWLFADRTAMATMLEIEPSGEHIADLADDAFWIGTAGILFVRHGDHAVEFQNPEFMLSAATDTANRDAMVTLARTALSNF